MKTLAAGPVPGHPAARRPPRGRTPRPVGRPRSRTADQAILAAAMELVAEVGLTGLTMSAVVARSRVARATVYRRYPTREALISAALAHVKGREPYRLTGDIAADLSTGAHVAVAVLGEEALRRYLPSFVSEALRGPVAARNVVGRVSPNHAGIAAEYRELAAASGFRTDIDPTLIGDIMIGTLLMRLLSTGVPPDEAAARQLTDIVIRGLREPTSA